MGVASRGVGHFLQFTGGSVDDEMNSGIGHKRSSDSGIQFMITNKMRATLRKDLGYQDDEIDDMKPEVRRLCNSSLTPMCYPEFLACACR